MNNISFSPNRTNQFSVISNQKNSTKSSTEVKFGVAVPPPEDFYKAFQGLETVLEVKRTPEGGLLAHIPSKMIAPLKELWDKLMEQAGREGSQTVSHDAVQETSQSVQEQLEAMRQQYDIQEKTIKPDNHPDVAATRIVNLQAEPEAGSDKTQPFATTHTPHSSTTVGDTPAADVDGSHSSVAEHPHEENSTLTSQTAIEPPNSPADAENATESRQPVTQIPPTQPDTPVITPNESASITQKNNPATEKTTIFPEVLGF